MELSEIKININFENLIPKQTAEQFKQLEENMVAEGRARNPLVLWHGILVDGHHRMRILKAHPEIKWSFVEQDFSDEDEAKEWIIKNALGTRNLTEMQITELRGRLYKARKKRVGEHKGNQYTRTECSEKPNIPKPQGRVSEQIAAELGINPDTVMTSSNFVDGLDAAESVVPGFRDDVLTGVVKAQKGEIAAMRKQTPEEIKKAVDSIKERKKKKRQSDRDLMERIKENISISSGVSTPQYGLAELIREIDALGDSFLLSLLSIVKRRKNIVTAYEGSREEIASRFDEIIERIEKMKGEL